MKRRFPCPANYLFSVALLIAVGLGVSVLAAGDPPPAVPPARIKGAAAKPNPRMEPRYELAPGMRDPFQPSVILVGTPPEEGSPEAGKIPNVPVPAAVVGPPSPTEVAAGIHLQAVFSKKGSNWGIFNGQPAKEGDAIECKIKGTVCKITVNKIELDPPRGVLRFGETEFSCDLQSTIPKLLK